MLAFATHALAPDLTPDDQLLAGAVRRRGTDVEAVVWDSGRSLAGFDAVVIRSTWDYHHRPAEFLAWIEEVERGGTMLVNPGDAVRWNHDKRYLLDLAADGIRIVPTELVEEGGPALREVMRTRGWSDVVVKPTISASAHETWRTGGAPPDEARFARLRDAGPGAVLVQPFVPEVTEDGEWSLIYFGGVFSHAAIKRPRAGDFRVQQEHGGRYERASPDEAIVAAGAEVVEAAARRLGRAREDFVYARVDGVLLREAGHASFALMELEAIEPALFFLHAPEAADRMAAVLVERVAIDRTAPGTGKGWR